MTVESSPLSRVEAYLAALELHDSTETEHARGRPFVDLIDAFKGNELLRSDLLDVVTKLKIAYGELAIGQGSELMDEAWHQGFDAGEEWAGLAKSGFGQSKPESPYRPKDVL